MELKATLLLLSNRSNFNSRIILDGIESSKTKKAIRYHQEYKIILDGIESGSSSFSCDAYTAHR